MTHKSCYICDKCGAEIMDIKGERVPLRVTLHNLSESGSYNTSFDFCKQCAKYVEKVVKSGFQISGRD
jgi:hypothetical protein